MHVSFVILINYTFLIFFFVFIIHMRGFFCYRSMAFITDLKWSFFCEMKFFFHLSVVKTFTIFLPINIIFIPRSIHLETYVLFQARDRKKEHEENYSIWCIQYQAYRCNLFFIIFLNYKSETITRKQNTLEYTHTCTSVPKIFNIITPALLAFSAFVYDMSIRKVYDHIKK